MKRLKVVAFLLFIIYWENFKQVSCNKTNKNKKKEFLCSLLVNTEKKKIESKNKVHTGENTSGKVVKVTRRTKVVSNSDILQEVEKLKLCQSKYVLKSL